MVTGLQTDLPLLEHFCLARLWHSLLCWITGTSTHLLAGAALHLFSTEGRQTWGQLSRIVSSEIICIGLHLLGDIMTVLSRDLMAILHGHIMTLLSYYHHCKITLALPTCQFGHLKDTDNLPGKVMAVGLFVVLVVSSAHFFIDSLALLLVVCCTFLICHGLKKGLNYHNTNIA